MEKISLRELKKELLGMSKDELVSDILALYKVIPEVREYYFAKLVPEAETLLLEKYKKIIEKEFYPDNRFGPSIRAKVIRKAISDFKKVAKSPVNVVDLMFFYVLLGIDFTNKQGDVDGEFYANLEKSFEGALQYSIKYEILAKVKENAKIIHMENKRPGWRFDKNIGCIYDVYYGNDNE